VSRTRASDETALAALRDERKQAELELKAAKEAAETAERRSAFLAEASEILSASLDYEATLASLARLAVPRIADDCVLFEVEERRVSRRIAVAHVNQEKEPLLERLSEIHLSSQASPPRILEEVVRSGRPRLDPGVSGESAAGPLAADLREIYGLLGRRSSLILPLVARGQTLGVLFLATSDSGRTFGPADLALGEELARRAAVAVDNARLFREVRAANDAKDQFLATLSHELRTPLTPVLALVAGLQEDERARGLRRELDVIRRNVELEARLIDDLLDLTRIARGKLELSFGPADARQVLMHALQTCARDLSSGRLMLSTVLAADDHGVLADGPRLTQVFWNLVRNAIKFTSAGGSVRVRSWNEAAPKRADGMGWLAVEVADTGIGIEPEVLPRIFDAFEQGQRSITRRFGGLGLGLAISKAILELHGGSLTAASEGHGRGSAFTVRLPLAAEAARAAGRMEFLARPAMGAVGLLDDLERPSSWRILLVEDHEDTAEAMADLLGVRGHQVTVARSLAEARAAAAESTFDLLVSDLGLPDGSGNELMREFSARYGLRGIALSGYGMEEDLRKSREAGFKRHLIKPVSPQALEAAIQQVAGAEPQSGES
jgi:signal transduction histidine kinase/CheY-like chemotaxis protein